MAEILAPVATNLFDANRDLKPQVEETILYKDLDYSPIGTMLARLNGIESWGNTIYYWSEHTAVKFQVTLTGAISNANAGVTQQVTFNSGNIRIGYIFYHAASKQQFQVVGFVSRNSTTSTMNIVRIPITLATVAVAGTPTLLRLSDQITEGGYYPVGEANTPTWLFNYTQICANTLAITRTMMKVETFWGEEWPRLLLETHHQHQSNWEASLWYGIAINESRTWTNENSLTSVGQMTQSQGLESRITSHVTPYSSLTMPIFKDWITEDVFGDRNYGPRDKWLVMGPGYRRQLYDGIEDKIRTVPGAEYYGVRVREYEFGDNSLMFVEEKLFHDNPDYTNTAFAIDPDNIGIVALGDQNTALTEFRDTSMPNIDNKSAVIRSEGGWKIKAESFMAKHYKT
jgi:hypothetical protein